MIYKKKHLCCLFILLSVFILFSFPTIHLSSEGIKDMDNMENNVEAVPKQSIWDVNEDILIDNDDPYGDFEDWNYWVGEDWCRYAGGVYYIENAVLNGFKIVIQHSTVNFIIENCTIINSGSDGILLKDVENGILRGNNISNNSANGIYIKYMRWTEFSFPFNTYEDSSNNIEIWNNTVSYNSDNGIYIEGRDNLLTCDSNNITDNTIIGNIGDGISINYGDTNTIVNNNFSFNYYGISIFNSDGNTINDNDCNYNYHGIYLSRSDDNIVNGNNANDNDEIGLYLRLCIATQSEWNNEITGNIMNDNKIGIHLYGSDYNYVGTGNTVNGNSQYGIYLSEGSSNNEITGNIVNNNDVHNIYCTDDCYGLNTFLNNGAEPVYPSGIGTGPGGFSLEYLIAILFLLFFIALIGGFSYIRVRNRNRMREAGIIETSIDNQQRVIFVRPGVIYSDQPTPSRQQTSSMNYYVQESDHKPIIPKEVEPYEFYCAKCDQKSLGYQVFCPTCGDRMKQPKLASMHNPDEKVQCVICHTETCATCNHGITGEDSCYEECPYCERSYHKHCWNKTMQAFGKCGFCLETPPPELIPNVFKSQNDTHFQDP